MAILHGSWLVEEQRFFLWGETWQHLEPETWATDFVVHEYPFALGVLPLIEQLQKLGGIPKATLVGKGRAQRREGDIHDRAWERWLGLPTILTPSHCLPQQSTAEMESPGDNLILYPWQVPGFWLSPVEAADFLQQLPLGNTPGLAMEIGPDLRFWAHVARWGLDLLARGKYLPSVGMTRKATTTFGRWQILLDSDLDMNRLRHFRREMPLACRFYQPPDKNRRDAPVAPWINFPGDPETLIRSFLGVTVDAQVRRQSPAAGAVSDGLSPELPVREWLQALSGEEAKMTGVAGGAIAAARLREALNTWTAPLQPADSQVQAFRLCFILTPPAQEGDPWQLVYALQHRERETLRIPASTLWQYPLEVVILEGEEIITPQETLLGGLGRAARLCEPVRESLTQKQPTHCPLDPAETYIFLKVTAPRLQDSGFGVVLPPGLDGQGVEGDQRLGIRLEAAAPERGDRQRLGLKSLLNVKWELAIAGQTVSQKDFEKLVALETPLVEINGQWVEIRPQDIRAAREFFKKRQEPITLTVEDALRMGTGDSQVLDKLPVVNFTASGVLQDLITTLTQGNQTLPPLAVPPDFTGTLRPYQERGVSWLAFLEQWGLGACLADDMGLGKTVQLIAFLLHLRHQGHLSGPTLLVCPTSVLGNWEREVRRFAPSLGVLLHHGDGRAKGAAFARKARTADIVLTSYALVYRDLKALERVEWQGLVLDEAQNIKNPEAKQSQAVRQLSAGFRIALTGTPVENRLTELWAIMDFLNPGYLGSKNFFQRRFATPIERYGDTASLRTLRSLVQPFILRRLKTDRTIIQDLPEKQEMTVFCGLSPEQADLYQTTVDEALETIATSSGLQRRGLILGLLTKLKQICNHPVHYLNPDNPSGPLQTHRSGKLQRFDAMVEELLDEGDRALIFTQFAQWGRLLQAHLERVFQQETLFLSGSTSQAQRDTMVERFQRDPQGPRLFILSLKAGGVGLNLTRANHVFHFDRWWNPAVENQATDRAFRIGQTRNVQVHKFVCNGTLEERIHDLIESKKTLSDQVVGEGEQWLTELDTDHLRQLLLLDRSAIIDDE